MKEEKTFVCPSCGVKTETKKQFTRHLKTHDNSKLKKCLLCDYRGRADNLERHIGLVHENKLRKTKKTTETKEPVKTAYECPTCHYNKLSSLDCLKRHMKTHDKARAKECPLCDYKSARKDTMNRHLRTKHQIENRSTAPTRIPSEVPLVDTWNQPEAKRRKLITQETQTDKNYGQQADKLVSPRNYRALTVEIGFKKPTSKRLTGLLFIVSDASFTVDEVGVTHMQ